MSNSVDIVELGEVAKFVRGITFKPDDKVEPFSPGSVVCFRTKNVQEQIDQDDLIAIPKQFVKRGEQYVQAGDILVSTANSWELVGKCSWVPELGYTSTIGGFISLLRANPAKVFPRYLYHWFNSPDTQVQARNCGRKTTNISNMNIGLAEKIQIPLPPLPEQRRLAAILDAADALRAKRRAALDKLEALGRGVFWEMFGEPIRNTKGWEVKQLGDVAKVASGSTPSREQADFYGGGIPWVKTTEINWGTIRNTDETVSSAGMKAARLRLFPKGSILIAMYGQGTTRGKSAILGIEATVNQACAVVMPSSSFTTEYLFTLLQMSYEGMRSLGRGGNQPNLNLGLIQTYPIIVPPIELQQAFSRAWGRIELLRERFLAQADTSNRLFGSLQKRAFRGSCRIQHARHRLADPSILQSVSRSC